MSGIFQVPKESSTAAALWQGAILIEQSAFEENVGLLVRPRWAVPVSCIVAKTYAILGANLSIVRKLALNIFRLDTDSKLRLPRKRKNAAWKPDYLFDLLGLQPVSEI